MSSRRSPSATGAGLDCQYRLAPIHRTSQMISEHVDSAILIDMRRVNARGGAPDRPTSARDRASSSAPEDELDHVDRELVERLRSDGRESNRSLAQALGMNEVTVASRIRKMEANSIMRVVAVTDMRIFGHREFAFASVRVSGRRALDVGAEIAKLPEVIAVTVSTGRYDIFVPLLARDHQHLAELFGVTFPKIAGVEEVTGHLALDVLKFETKWALLTADPGTAPDAQPSETVDELDISIIKLLQVDARRSNRRIATELGVSEGTVRGRIKRLLADRVIRVQAVSDAFAFGISAHAFVGITTRDGQTDEVGQHLKACDNVAQLTRTLGEYDFIAVVIANTREALVSVLVNDIAVIPGIRWTDTFETCATTKHAYPWSWLV